MGWSIRNLTGLARIDIPNNRQLYGAFLDTSRTCLISKTWSYAEAGLDAGLTHLEHCDGLESLMLDRTKVTEAGLSKLKRLPNFRSLDLTYWLTNKSLGRARSGAPSERSSVVA